MLVGIVLIVLGAAAGSGALVPERHQRKYLLIVGALTVAFGITNLIIQDRGASQLVGKVDRYGTVTNWQTSEATLEVEGAEIRKQAAYALVVKIIPAAHDRVKALHIPLRQAHSLNEPAYIDDAIAQKLFWIMADATGTIDVLNEYRSGIYTYYYTGRFDEAAGAVIFRPDAMSYWPALYPSLADLQGKYIVARVLAAGVDQPMFTDLRLKLGSPAGEQLVIMLPTILKTPPDDPAVKRLILSSERYIGGRLSEKRFVPD